MKSAFHQHRTQSGSFIAEVPIALWILFIGFTFPLLDLSTIFLRNTFLLAASRDAAHEAARCRTFRTSISATDLSSQQAAPIIAAQTASRFQGVRITTVNTFIVRTDINSQAVTRYSTALTQPADTSTYLYSIETAVTGQVDPLLTVRLPFFNNIQGLSAPVTTRVVAREFCEYPQGLNQ